METQLLDLHQIDKEEWNEFIRASLNGTAFNTVEWARVWELSLPRVRPLFVLLKDSEIRAGILLIEIRKAGFRSYYSMPYGGYGGVIVRDQASNTKDQKLQLIKRLNELARGRWGTIAFSDLYDQGKDCRLDTCGFSRNVSSTHMLDLHKDPQAIFRNLAPSKRQKVRQAQKKGVRISVVKDRQDIEECYRMIEDTARRHGQQAPLFPLDLYLNIFDQMGEFLMWNVASRGGKKLANTLHFVYKDTIVYWDSGSYASALQYRPNDALIWESISWGCEHGYRYYNLGGSPSPGLVTFKRRWGAREKRYWTYCKRSWLFRVLKSAQKAISK